LFRHIVERIPDSALTGTTIVTFIAAKSSMPTGQQVIATSIDREGQMDVIKVKASSRTAAVAGAIAGVVREHKHADVQAIGAGAVNQAVKALVLATGYLAEDGIEVVCKPEFVEVEIDSKVRTAIKLVVQLR
jgi:stage V sporulation protein S